MQAAQYALPGTGVVILDEVRWEPRLDKALSAIGLQKETTRIAKNLGLYQDDVRDCSVNEFHVADYMADPRYVRQQAFMGLLAHA
jgi:hypothetical protein